MNLIANGARRLLINSGKAIPFCLCFLLFIAYTESIIALYTGNFLYYDGCMIPNTPISFYIAGNFIEYDMFTVVIIFVISYSIETCYWNKLACLYLLIHIAFKIYIQDVELDESMVVILSTINVVVSGILVYKGVRMVK